MRDLPVAGLRWKRNGQGKRPGRETKEGPTYRHYGVSVIAMLSVYTAGVTFAAFAWFTETETARVLSLPAPMPVPEPPEVLEKV